MTDDETTDMCESCDEEGPTARCDSCSQFMCEVCADWVTDPTGQKPEARVCEECWDELVADYVERIRDDIEYKVAEEYFGGSSDK